MSICSSFCCIQFPLARMLLSAWHPPCRLQAQECCSGLIHFPVPISFPLKLLLVYIGRSERAFLRSGTKTCPYVTFPHVSCALRSQRCACRCPTTETIHFQAAHFIPFKHCSSCVQCKQGPSPVAKRSGNPILQHHDQVVVFKRTDPDGHKVLLQKQCCWKFS